VDRPKFKPNPKKFTSPVARQNQPASALGEEPVAQLEESNVRKHQRNLRGVGDGKGNRTESEVQKTLGKRRRLDPGREMFVED
jgi:hypothetical protein